MVIQKNVMQAFQICQYCNQKIFYIGAYCMYVQRGEQNFIYKPAFETNKIG